MDWLILLAGGKGERAGAGPNKVYRNLHGAPVLTYSLRVVRALPVTVGLVVVARGEDRTHLDRVLRSFEDLAPQVVIGGATRHESEQAGLAAILPSPGELIGIHDAARPFLTAALWQVCRDTAAMVGGAVPVVAAGPLFEPTPWRFLEPRNGLAKAQTPQVFSAPDLIEAYHRADRPGFDTSETVERFSSLSVAAVAGDPRNLKITFSDDFARAAALAPQWTPEAWLSN